MIITRAFYREAAKTTFGIALVLLIVMTLMNLTLLLGRAVRGGPPESVLYQLLGYQMLGKIDILLPLAFYLGVLLTLSRWYRDNEMTVLAACGVGLMHFLRPVLFIAVGLAAVVLVTSFYATPLALRQIEKIKAESTQQTEPHQIAPGVFTESPRSNRIFYAERIEPDGDMEGVFVSGLDQGRRTVLKAKSGRPFTDERTGDRFVALRDGTLYEGAPGAPDYRILEFDVYSLRIEPRFIDEPEVSTAALPTRQLLQRLSENGANAEWHWRLAKTLAVFVLAVYALVFAYTDMRRGRLSNLFAAIVVYFVYSNFLGVGEAVLQDGRMPRAAGLWWVHVGMGLIAVALLRQRFRNRPLVSLPWNRA